MCWSKVNENCVYNLIHIAKPWQELTTHVAALSLQQSLEGKKFLQPVWAEIPPSRTQLNKKVPYSETKTYNNSTTCNKS